MRIVTSAADLLAAGRPSGATALVMTMGALHDGHAQLMRAARRDVSDGGAVIVSIFVNPTQFAPGEDFERYPRSLDDDLELCEAAGVDLVLTPSVEEVYGHADGMAVEAVTVDPGPLGNILEGVTRKGHFRGVLTVVHKVMSMTAADAAYFGEKDYQQLILIRRMARDLNMAVRVVGRPTVREADGLALSSRNRYLSPEERTIATTVPHALETVAASLGGGVEVAVAAGREVVAATAGIALEYLEVTDSELGTPPSRGSARALIAVRIGSTRLIDNVPCWLGRA